MANTEEDMKELGAQIEEVNLRDSDANITIAEPAITERAPSAHFDARTLAERLSGYEPSAQPSSWYFNVAVKVDGQAIKTVTVERKNASTVTFLWRDAKTALSEFGTAVPAGTVEVYEAKPGWDKSKGIDPSWTPLEPTQKLTAYPDEAWFVVAIKDSAPKQTDLSTTGADIKDGAAFRGSTATTGGGAVHSLSDIPALPAAEHISQVVAAIRGGHVTQSVSGHLLLPEGLCWPIATNNTLFVRKFYVPLLEKVLNMCLPCKPQGMPHGDTAAQRRIVTGQPGIGKSVWIWFVIYRVLREQPKRTVVLIVHSARKVFFIPPEGPVRVAKLTHFAVEDVDDMTGLGQHPLVIADSVLPPVLRHPTLVVSSPGRLANRELKDTLNNYWDQRFYMPVPTMDELREMHAVAFSHLDKAGVEQRLQLWGPIPRHVLVKVEPAQQRALWRSAASVGLDSLVALARGHASGQAGQGDEQDAPHRLVHERAAGQDAEAGSTAADPSHAAFYERGEVVVASLSILRYIADLVKKAQAWNAAFIVDASLGIGALGALRGLKFEHIVCALLEEGVELACRDLRDGSTSTLKVLAAPREVWSKPADLEKLRGSARLLVPRDRNEAGLDALIWHEEAGHHWPVDSTVSATHGLHAQGLADAVQALGWTPDGGWPRAADKKNRALLIKYFWAVPDDRFVHGWTAPQAAKKGTDTSAAAKATFAHIQQYALCVPPAVTITRVAKACEQEGVLLPHSLVPSE